MAEETQTAVPATEEQPPSPADPNATPAGDPTTEPTPKPDGGDKPPEGEEKPPEAESALDKFLETLSDPDEIEAVAERIRERLPEDRRSPKDEQPADTGPSAWEQEQRRQEEKRQHEAKRDGAVAKLNAHLGTVKKQIAAGDEADYDNDLLSSSINEIVQAEIALADSSYKELVAQAITHRAGKIEDAEFKAMAKAVADGKVEHGIIGAYLDKIGERRYQEGLAEGQAQAKSKDEKWRKAEAAAVRAELMRERNLEPETKPAPTAPGDAQARLDRLSGFAVDSAGNRIQPTEEDLAWLRARN